MPETIGQRLKQIRLSRQISIEKAAEATRVRAHYLQALEADNYSAMSSAAQSRGFLRLYADFLGLDLESAMTELREGETVGAPPKTPAPASAIPTPEPVPAPQTPPASAADGKPVRRPFWARLLRRPVPDESAAELEPVPAVTSPVAEEPAPAPAIVVEPVTVPVPEPELTTVRAKKPAAKKASSSAKADKPKISKPKSTPKADDKKKASLKNNPAKKR
jgi:transcriptional regulator with XRE-family HTH domain